MTDIKLDLPEEEPPIPDDAGPPDDRGGGGMNDVDGGGGKPPDRYITRNAPQYQKVSIPLHLQMRVVEVERNSLEAEAMCYCCQGTTQELEGEEIHQMGELGTLRSKLSSRKAYLNLPKVEVAAA